MFSNHWLCKYLLALGIRLSTSNSQTALLNIIQLLTIVFLRRPKDRRSNIALDLQFMQIFTNQKYS